ncbi:MAG: hypothetical protein HeimC3_41130 [Candidatus Heimdallarchaeota archaeon LC_3]|nr:MAG: hypothetical protein HeimC3_41130 [Candidatus Heimdallarchaeota archaeon LC_3]
MDFSIKFHEKTKHSAESVYGSTWSLDWDNRPFPFKVYPDLVPITLSEDYKIQEKSALDAISTNPEKSDKIRFNKQLLTTFLFFTGGISRVIKHPEHSFYMRTASATGALYPIELYVITQNFSDLENGVYHFSVGDFTLNQIRKGNYFKHLSNNCSESEIDVRSPLTLLYSSYAIRNSWKYRTRSYRHWFWDGGVMMANTIAIASAFNLQSKIITSFNDQALNKLCGLTDKQEAIIALISFNQDDIADLRTDKKNNFITNVPNIKLDSLKLAKKAYNFESIWDIHQKTSFLGREDLQKWNDDVNSCINFIKIKKPNKIIKSFSQIDVLDLEKTILQRGSTNRFKQEPIPKESFLLILKSANSGIPSDFLPNNESTFLDCYINVHDVMDVDSGSYHYDIANNTLSLLKPGNFRNETSQLCLGQQLFGSTNAIIFLLTNLEKIVHHFGDRAYRVAQLEGGIVSGKLYLSSYALKFGARGTTFFDDEVTKFFSPHANKKSVMTAVGIGIPDYKTKAGKKLKPVYTREKITQELINHLT